MVALMELVNAVLLLPLMLWHLGSGVATPGSSRRKLLKLPEAGSCCLCRRRSRLESPGPSLSL